MAKRPGSAGDPLWYKDAIICDLHLRAFKDSNADSIGDFHGLIQKTGLSSGSRGHLFVVAALLPFPLKNDRYDISDYMNVHSMYGAVDDFRALLAAAHGRDLRARGGSHLRSASLFSGSAPGSRRVS
jgi:maltose alpha-D-glucosyltransferase/alpha-amylase